MMSAWGGLRPFRVIYIFDRPTWRCVDCFCCGYTLRHHVCCLFLGRDESTMCEWGASGVNICFCLARWRAYVLSLIGNKGYFWSLSGGRYLCRQTSSCRTNLLFILAVCKWSRATFYGIALLVCDDIFMEVVALVVSVLFVTTLIIIHMVT